MFANMLILCMLSAVSIAQNTSNNATVGGFSGGQKHQNNSKQNKAKKKLKNISNSKGQQANYPSLKSVKPASSPFRSLNKPSRSLNSSFLQPQSSSSKKPSGSLNHISSVPINRKITTPKGSPFGHSQIIPSMNYFSKNELKSTFKKAPFIANSSKLPLNYFLL